MTPAKPYDLALEKSDYPLWSGPPHRSILICTIPRSGSTLLGEALFFAGGMGCPLEYFHAGFRPRFEARWGTSSLTDLRDAVWANRTDPSGILSVKLMWRDVQELAIATDPLAFAELIEQPPEQIAPATYSALAELLEAFFPRSTAIHLQRLDRVRQAVSACIAEQTGQWRSIPGAEMPLVNEPRYEAAQIDRQISYADFAHRNWRNLLSAMPTPPIAITYEQLVGSYDECVADLLRQLGSKASVPPIRMRRQANATSERHLLRYLSDKAVTADA